MDLIWASMMAAERLSLASIQRDDIPVSPGVYALFRDGERIYVGKAGSLRRRIWQNHCGRGRVMTGSAMRRNIAEHLGIATAADIKAGRYQPTDDEITAVRAWLDACEIAWIETCGEPEAIELETTFKREFRPPLTRR